MQRWQLGPARFDWSEQFIFDLLLDRLQPTFGAASAALEVLDFAFELLDAILSITEAWSGSPSIGRGHVGSMAENKRCRLAEDA